MSQQYQQLSSVNYKSTESGGGVLEEECWMSSLHHLTILHHNDPVTTQHRVNSVGYGYHCSVSQTLLDNILQQIID